MTSRMKESQFWKPWDWQETSPFMAHGKTSWSFVKQESEKLTNALI